MPDPPFTIDDTPEVVARVRRDLTTILSTVRDADPALRALVLTGGFARGEGSVLHGQPQNDYDLVAIRGWGRPRVPYAQTRADLERRLGLHVDLAPVAGWRLRWVPPTIFWYETALRGRVLWGPDVLQRIPVRGVHQLDAAEALRLLVNRAAGLLLVTNGADAHARRLQAAKAFLAAADAHLLARGEFAPSQRERWIRFEELQTGGSADPALVGIGDWLAWAFRYKVDPANAPPRAPEHAWTAAARTLLNAVPLALRHAGLSSLDAYARKDGLLDHVVYLRRSGKIPGARTLVLNPTGRVRVATLRLLESSLDGQVRPDVAHRCFRDVARVPRTDHEPLRLLDALRHATLQ